VKDQARELRKRYLREAVETATPAERLVMIYDRLCVDLSRAATGFEQHDWYLVNEALVHAQNIILTLASTLDTESWPAGRELLQLYNFWHCELVRVNLEKDASGLVPVTNMVRQLAEAWRTAADGMRETASAAS